MVEFVLHIIKMTRVPHITTVLAVVALSSSSIVKPPSAGGNFELLILHNNDMHAKFEQTSQLSGTCTTADREKGKCYGGFPRVAHVVKEARKAAASGEGPPVLYLNAGDTYTGTVWFTIYKWKVAAEFLNALQPDAVSLGNHEFDQGVNGLSPFIENLTCPVLAANLDLRKVPELEKEANLRKSVVFNISGTSVGVVGYLTPETKILAIKNDVEYIDEIIAIREEVKKLKSEGVNIIIGLGHSGYLRDLEIAKKVEGLNLVIGGHSNTFLWNGTSPDSEKSLGPYPTYVTQSSGKQVPVVQAYAYTKYLGKLHMVFNNKGDILSADGNAILLDKTIPQDPEVLEIVERYRGQIQNYTEEIIGTTSVVLDGLSCQHQECNMGNLITDAMISCYTSEYRGKNQWTDTPIAVIQGGGMRSSIGPTEMPAHVTKGDLIAILPFEGEIGIVTMKGKVLMEMLEHSVENLSDLDHPGEFLQVSGIKVVYDNSKKAGSKVVSAEARCWNCSIPEFSKIVDEKEYNVIIPYFIYSGGDGYAMLSDLPMRALNFSQLSCTMDYIKHHSPVYPGIEGRVIVLNQNTNRGSINSLSQPFLFILIINVISTNLSL